MAKYMVYRKMEGTPDKFFNTEAEALKAVKKKDEPERWLILKVESASRVEEIFKPKITKAPLTNKILGEQEDC